MQGVIISDTQIFGDITTEVVDCYQHEHIKRVKKRVLLCIYECSRTI